MDYQQYLDDKMHQLRVVCQSQWDYLKYIDLDRWLNTNFQNDLEGRYFATKILLHTVYYSKKNLENLLHYGLYEKIIGKIIKTELITGNNIYLNTSLAESKVKALIDLTYFVPLLDSNKPSESGNGIIGDLVHKLSIKEAQEGFHWNITEEVLKNYRIIIFVDDCVGSGNQLKRFWKTAKLIEIRNLCRKLKITMYYMVLVGYKDSVEKLRQSDTLKDLDIVVCDILTDSNRVFHPSNIIWDKPTNEIERAIKYFERIKITRGVNFLGYKKLDFAVILHDRLPNWSLPIFWKSSEGWSNLLTRKTTNF